MDFAITKILELVIQIIYKNVVTEITQYKNMVALESLALSDNLAPPAL